LKNSPKDLPSEIILKWSKEIASGMNMIHSTGIVHRDLKTFLFFSFFFILFLSKKKKKNRSNILLEIKSGKMNAIICDFGLARMNSEGNVIFLSFFSFRLS